MVERGFETIALDADIKMLEQVGHPSIRIIHTPATETTLPDASQDLVLCLQAFHWLDAEAALAEFSRVLKISIYALSYGTYALNTYLQLPGARADALVMDGPVTPDRWTLENNGAWASRVAQDILNTCAQTSAVCR